MLTWQPGPTMTKWLFCRKLPCIVHWREGFWLQGLHISSCYSWIHVPGLALFFFPALYIFEHLAYTCITRPFIPTPYFRAGISPMVMVLEASPSMARSLLMRTSSWSTQMLERCPWLMLGPTPTDHSFSSAQTKPPGKLGMDEILPKHQMWSNLSFL